MVIVNAYAQGMTHTNAQVARGHGIDLYQSTPRKTFD
jgi:hypothetical protein